MLLKPAYACTLVHACVRVHACACTRSYAGPSGLRWVGQLRWPTFRALTRAAYFDRTLTKWFRTSTLLYLSKLTCGLVAYGLAVRYGTDVRTVHPCMHVHARACTRTCMCVHMRARTCWVCTRAHACTRTHVPCTLTRARLTRTSSWPASFAGHAYELNNKVVLRLEVEPGLLT